MSKVRTAGRNCTHCELTRITIRVHEYTQGFVPCAAFCKIPATRVDICGSIVGNNTYNKVLKTTSTMTTKNARASSACSDLRNDKYITSIVLMGSVS